MTVCIDMNKMWLAENLYKYIMEMTSEQYHAAKQNSQIIRYIRIKSL